VLRFGAEIVFAIGSAFAAEADRTNVEAAASATITNELRAASSHLRAREAMALGSILMNHLP
jgi:hypothetical protein